MTFVAQVLMIACSVIAFAIVLDAVATNRVFAALDKALDFTPAQSETPNLRLSPAGKNEGDAPTGAAGDQLTQ